ncbi:MAG: hypothetical protein Q8M01_09575 [Rubrivivax sp.]|nr:hypothetical protein [Rubrivivax sp.]
MASSWVSFEDDKTDGERPFASVEIGETVLTQRGVLGDAPHALSWAAGYNIHWLMRAIVRLPVRQLSLALFGLTLHRRVSVTGAGSAVLGAVGPLRQAIDWLPGFKQPQPAPVLQLTEREDEICTANSVIAEGFVRPLEPP